MPRPMDPSLEQWRPVVGYEGFYEVSDQGRVRSVDRTILRTDGCKANYKGRVLRIRPSKRFGVVTLSRGNKFLLAPVHILVLEAFVGQRPDGCKGFHRNRNRSDNRLVNLQWADRPTIVAGRLRDGSYRPNARLTPEQVTEIKERYAAGGTTYRLLADDYGVHVRTIGHLITGRNWRPPPVAE